MKDTQGSRQSFFSRKSTRYGFNAAVITLLMLGIVVLIQVISFRNSQRWDLTANKRYTLSGQSMKLLKSLEHPIRVIAFYREGEPGRVQLKDLLEQYIGISEKFIFEFVDPDRNPIKAKNYEITSYGTTVVEKVTDKEDDDRKQQLTSLPNEEDITNAILKVTQPDKKIIYFLKGHGEPGLEDVTKDGYSYVKQAIEKENYEVKELVLLREEKVPKDAVVVAVCGPKKALLPEEVRRLSRYILQGGKVLFMVDPFSSPELVFLLKKYNLWLGEDVIIDKQTRITGSDITTNYHAMPIVSKYENHPITRGFREFSVFPWTRSVTPYDPKGKVHARVLARTAETSWAEANQVLFEQGEAEYDHGEDSPGPVSVAAVATVDTRDVPEELKADLEQETALPSSSEKTVEPTTSNEEDKGEDQDESPKGRLVVFGNSAFAGNNYLGILGNQDFFLNAISWLAEEEDLISIRPKTLKGNPMILTSRKAHLVFWVPVVFLPVSVLLTGFLILYYRRRI